MRPVRQDQWVKVDNQRGIIKYDSGHMDAIWTATFLRLTVMGWQLVVRCMVNGVKCVSAPEVIADRDALPLWMDALCPTKDRGASPTEGTEPES